MAEKYDIAVVGAGPGGYVAAIRAAQLGFKTVCIDKRSSPGGTCLNVGCIPSKSLLQSTELMALLQHHGKEYGIEYADLKMNFPHLMERKNRIVKSLTEGVAGLFNRHGVQAVNGEASFVDSHTLTIKGPNGVSEIQADNFLIATGSDPIELAHMPFDEKQILSSTGALALTRIPKDLLVVGGGVIGVELASVYQRLGSRVTIVEMLDNLCPGIDLGLSKQLLQSLKKQGIEIQLSSKVVTAVLQPDEVILTIDQGGRLVNKSVEMTLVAVGRRPIQMDCIWKRPALRKTRGDSFSLIKVSEQLSRIFLPLEMLSKGLCLRIEPQPKG